MIPNEELNQYKPGQSGNPNGRPPKLISHINKQLKGEGYKQVSVSQIAECYELLLNLNEDKIKELTSDIGTPMLLKIVGKAMLGGKGTEMIERILDRIHGKAKQVNEVKLNNDKPIIINWGESDTPDTQTEGSKEVT